MKKKITRAVPVIVAAGLMSNLFCAESVHAIPAFTRANKVECSTCHTIFPELNEYGEAFLKNGYVYFGKGKKKSAEHSRAPVAIAETKPAALTVDPNNVKGDGDAPESETRSEGIGLSGIPEQLPVSFTASLQATYNRDAANEFDFSTRSLKLNAGGNFKEKAGFFGTYLLYTENVDKSANTSNIPTNMAGKNDIGELFVIWRHALDSAVNLKVGRFQPKLGLWKSNNKLSIANPYATYSYTVGSSLFKGEQAQDAVEANMIIAGRLFLAGGAVNRKNQNTKEWYAHTSVKIGGADYLANEPEIDLNSEESAFDFLTVTIGGYGYGGTNGDPNSGTIMPLRQNDYYRAGADIELLYKLFRLKLSGVMGRDDNPDLNHVKPPVKTYAAAVESQYTIRKNLIGSLRFEYIDTYIDGGTSIYRRYIPTLAYSPVENLKVVAEYKYEHGMTYKTTEKKEISNQAGTLGVTFGF